ncbi:MAG: alpha-amylase family glycosyl hydrolase [Anaerolineales bacterium]|nr:alpha-amylase family glycosyl hydrolase [Anaerolineales bacterium]MDW8447694.1 alpha-amylase family glycosyl hydrolase [Anaerolineales bacterium]
MHLVYNIIVQREDLLRDLWQRIYGPGQEEAFKALLAILRAYSGENFPLPRTELDQRDVLLITYPDQVKSPEQPPLQTLGQFCRSHLADLVTVIHLLPFYPWSSDDGFAVIDYYQVDPRYGTWGDIQELRRSFRLMFDAVINHVSAQSPWFQRFVQGDPEAQDDFIALNGDIDLAQVFRPRTTPLLSTFQTAQGEKRLWTTFSADQVDLNYHNPRVLLKVIDLLLFYAQQGASFLRLDAVAFLWKELGTPCINLPQTHAIVQLFRAVLEAVAPQVRIITETNVSHLENVAYFGDGTNEAHLVYNFALPPLVLHALYNGDGRILSNWVASLELPSDQVTFLNFLASHDGIGIGPVRGILSEEEIASLVSGTLQRNGLVSYRTNPDGSTSPYELNINYFDALSDPHREEPLEMQIRRFVAAHALMLALPGIPAFYFHSLFGSRGWPEGVKLTGQNRAINRQKLFRLELEAELADSSSLRARVFSRLKQLILARASHPAFTPLAAVWHVMGCAPSLFALHRQTRSGEHHALCLQNLSCQPQTVDLSAADSLVPRDRTWVELLEKQRVDLAQCSKLILEPYQTLWLASF